jgi:hypothetical protein
MYVAAPPGWGATTFTELAGGVPGLSTCPAGKVALTHWEVLVLYWRTKPPVLA